MKNQVLLNQACIALVLAMQKPGAIERRTQRLSGYEAMWEQLAQKERVNYSENLRARR